MDFEHFRARREYITHVERFIRDRVLPNEQTYVEQLARTDDWRRWRIPRSSRAQAEARERVCGIFSFPTAEYGAGLDNRDYAPIAELTGRSFSRRRSSTAAPPDTGNAECWALRLRRAEARWLGRFCRRDRSGFAMTSRRSRRATRHMKATCEVVGDQAVINGRW